MGQSMMAEPVTPAAAPSGLSLRGLWEVFYKPTEFFGKIKDHPRIFIPWIGVAIASALMFYFLADFLVEFQMEAMRKNPNMRPEYMPTAEQMKPWMYVGALILCLLPLLTGAIAMFWGNFIFGGRAKYSQLLSVMVYGLWVYMVGGVVQAIMALMKGSIKTSLSLAALVPNRPVDDTLYMLLSKFSVFQVWEIVAVGIGLSVVYGFSRNKGYTIAVLSVGLIAAIHVLMTALS